MVANRLPSEEKTITVEKQKVVLSDCLQYLMGLQDKSIDLFVTSPPYNIGIKYGVYQDNKSFNDYLAWLNEIFSQVRRVLRDDGSVFLNVGCTSRNPWLAFDVIGHLRNLFALQNRIVWVKSISIGDITYGHLKPVNSERFVNHTYEEIFHLTKTGGVKLNRTAIGVPYMDKNNLKRKSDSLDLRCRGNCWFIPYETINSKRQKGNHPAIFPEQLVEMCIKLAGYDSETVVCDPFLGSGTTLVVAKRLGIYGIGVEIDQNYFEYSCRRLIAN
jgi:site-specific DNA-methyltransferase (adenine-specific)